MATTSFRACPLCEAICGLEIQSENGRPTAIRGDAADPFSQGHVCPKGNAIIDLEADPDRLSTPMRQILLCSAPAANGKAAAAALPKSVMNCRTLIT